MVTFDHRYGIETMRNPKVSFVGLVVLRYTTVCVQRQADMGPRVRTWLNEIQ